MRQKWQREQIQWTDKDKNKEMTDDTDINEKHRSMPSFTKQYPPFVY